MTSYASTLLRPAARAASHAPEAPGFVATLAPAPIAPALPRAARGAVAASLRAPLAPSSVDLSGTPRAAARAASSIA